MPRFKDRLSSLKDWYNRWNEFVWFKAANRLLVVGIAILLVVLQGIMKILRVELDFTKIDPTIIALAVTGLLCVYLYTVAIMTTDILDVERSLRSSEQRFHFNRGTLFYGTEPGIYMRVPTFQHLLAAVGTTIGDARAREVFVELGRDAAEDFCRKLPKIYDENYQRLVGGQKWELLPQKRKIERWLEYDSQAGWGNLAGRISDKEIIIHVHHFEKLFEGRAGTLFAFFMAGYCLAVLNSILKSSDGDFREAIIDSEPVLGDVVKIGYHLR